MVVYPFLLTVRLLATRQFSPIVHYLPVTLGLTLMVLTRGRARPMEYGVVCQPRVLVCLKMQLKKEFYYTCFSSFRHGYQDLLSSPPPVFFWNYMRASALPLTKAAYTTPPSNKQCMRSSNERSIRRRQYTKTVLC